MAKKIGFDGKLYRNTGSYGTPSWNEITEVRDCGWTIDVDAHEVGSRAGRTKKYLPGRVDVAFEFGLSYDSTVDDEDALFDAALAGTNIEFAMMDGSISTTANKGIRMDAAVYSWNRSEPLDGGMENPGITIKPAPNANSTPIQYTVP